MSLRLRLVAAFAYVLLLVIVALEIPLVLNVSRRVDAEIKAQAAAEAQLVAASASGEFEDPAALDRLANEAAGNLAGRVIVVDGRGLLLADSEDAGLGTSYEGRPEIREALVGGRTAQGKRFSSTLDQNLLFTAVPVVAAGRRIGAVRVTQSVDAVQARVRRDVLGLVAIGALALLLGLGVAWLLADSLSRPLRGLARTARRVEAGDVGARAEVKGSSEQQEVALAFNDMTERLGSIVAAQREFVSNASHQLRTPLTGLRLRLEAASLRADASIKEELEAAELEVERLAKLLSALLTLAREGERPPAPGTVALAEAVARAEERWSRSAELAGRRLTTDCGEPAFAQASEEDVAIALDNLVENALLYTPRGRSVRVECGRDGAFAYLAVLDEGPGVEPGEEARMFERFARGSAGRRGPSGTGLGLAIVATLARRWGGEARIGNRPEGGARAEVRFPATRGSGTLPPSKTELDGALPGAV